MDMDSSGRARMRLPTADLPPDCAAPVTSESPWSGGPGGQSLNVCDRPRSIRPCSVRSVQLSRRSPSRPISNAGRAGSARPDGSRARRPRTGRARRRGSACGSVPAPPPACRPAAGCPPSPRAARAAQSPCSARSAVRGPGFAEEGHRVRGHVKGVHRLRVYVRLWPGMAGTGSRSRRSAAPSPAAGRPAWSNPAHPHGSMYSASKNATFAAPTVGTTSARSRKSLRCSQLVSAISRQPWQAAPCSGRLS